MSVERVVCLNCIDGRVQLPVIQWIKHHYDAEHVDMVTEPGLDGILADPNTAIEAITKKVQVSIDKNQAAFIFIVGHYDCRGNPVDADMHQSQVCCGVQRLKKTFSALPVIGLWVNRRWDVEEIISKD